MNIVDIITKKKNKQVLSYEEIKFLVDGFLNGDVKDYQMSSLLMAIVLNGMNDDETINLTKVMLDSGEKIDLSSINGIKVDKHSTGGIGDKTTLVVAPLVASCNVAVAKMSGRGLGFTGGTIDKLESIEGFNTNISNEEFIKQVNKISLALVSQTGNLVPADKKIYALRDVTGTTESIPLIASSIMSKKLASGADKIVLDIKVGKGAFMKNIEDARSLSNIMINIGKKFNKEVIALITNMNYPLGYTIGNGLEVKEAIDTLNGKGEERFTKLCIVLASYMVSLGLNINVDDAFNMVKEKLNNKDGYNKFKELVKAQGGNIDKIAIEKNKVEIKSPKSGYIVDIDAIKLAEFVNNLGAGRKTKEDTINHGVGIILNKKVNDEVKKDETLGYVICKDIVDTSTLSDAFTISDNNIDDINIIYEVVK